MKPGTAARRPQGGRGCRGRIKRTAGPASCCGARRPTARGSPPPSGSCCWAGTRRHLGLRPMHTQVRQSDRPAAVHCGKGRRIHGNPQHAACGAAASRTAISEDVEGCMGAWNRKTRTVGGALACRMCHYLTSVPRKWHRLVGAALVPPKLPVLIRCIIHTLHQPGCCFRQRQILLRRAP